MPELPEVETIRIGLSQKIIGLKIKDVQVLNMKSFQGKVEEVVGGKIAGVWRRAKMLGIDLGGDLTLLIHLKMSGQIILVDQRQKAKDQRLIGGHPTHDMLGELPNKSTRVIFELEESSPLRSKKKINSYLYFNDQRKFGWIKLLSDDASRDLANKTLNSLGPEPLEKGFSNEVFKTQLLERKNQPVKVVILDQTIISGVGNIYACEALFNAKIHPKRKVMELSDEDIERLRLGVIKALKEGVKYGGSTRTHFVNSEGKKGMFLDHAFVYNREGDICKICGHLIAKIKLGGRGTFFCPNCQK